VRERHVQHHGAGDDARGAAAAGQQRRVQQLDGAGTVTLATPLANGASIDLRFLTGIQQTGNFKIYLNIEALP
jgi:hypothetical protein